MNISQWDYYRQESEKISDQALQDIHSLKDWQAARPRLLREFFESMGLPRLPDYREVNFTDCGVVKGKGFRMQKIAYQILPDCWASACIYRPDPMPAGQAPAILYTCGHADIGTYASQRHAIMWARRGYICMGFDTIEQNDNPGNHHGLHNGRRPDWVSMGYSAAGGELWNSIRALDMLEQTDGVDRNKIGVTGSSGGGAHSFFLAIADERIKAVATCCGVVRPKYLISRQHLMTHCDCMCYHNLYRRDPIEFAALIAPRPLLFCFAIEDYLFSVELYKELHEGAKKIWRYYDRATDCRLFDYHGGHGYQPESVEYINKWFDKNLAGAPHPLLPLAEHELGEKQISVFNGKPPQPNRLAMLPELLSETGAVALPQNRAEWKVIRNAARQTIKNSLMMNFDGKTRLHLNQLGNWIKGSNRYRKYSAARRDNEVWVETLCPLVPSDKVLIGVADSGEHARDVLLRLSDICRHNIVSIVPRFCGFNNCAAQSRWLLSAGAYTGMTPFMLMLEDLQLIMPAVLKLPELQGKKIIMYGKGDAGVCALYQTILNETIAGVALDTIPATHRQGAYFLNVLKHLDIQHATGLTAPRRVGFVNAKPSLWTTRLYERLGCPQNIIEGHSVKEIIEKI